MLDLSLTLEAIALRLEAIAIRFLLLVFSYYRPFVKNLRTPGCWMSPCCNQQGAHPYTAGTRMVHVHHLGVLGVETRWHGSCPKGREDPFSATHPVARASSSALAKGCKYIPELSIHNKVTAFWLPERE